MNKRILELAKQAGFHVTNGYIFIPYTSGEITVEQERFAQLIVQEICKELDRAQWDKGEDWVCADGTRIIAQIEQHFGVK